MHKDKNHYKPLLATNKKYLKKVARAIKEKVPLEDIKFQLLNKVISSLGFNDNPYNFLESENLKIKSVQSIIDKTFKVIEAGISK